MLHGAGYRTALIGKPHFEPFLDPFGRFAENALRHGHRRRRAAAHRGFEHLEFATHSAAGGRCTTPAGWRPSTPRRSACSTPCSTRDLEVNARRRRRHRRAAGARQPDPARVVPHRLGGRSHDRLARLARRRRRLVLLDELPRPAPPVGSAGSPRWAASTGATCRCPAGYPESPAERERILDAKPRHWRLWYDGTLVSNYEAPHALGAGDAHRRPGARGQRPQRRRVSS